MRNALRHLWHLPRNATVSLLRAYQRTLSPDHGPLRHLHPYGYCRHSPTCSQYAIDAVVRRGAMVGSVLAVGRVLTCHPWKKPDERRVAEILERRIP